MVVIELVLLRHRFQILLQMLSEFKGCVRYFWGYNNVYAAVIIIKCSFQNICYTKLPVFIPCNILRFSCLYRSVLHVLHVFNPEIIEANTILKKMYICYCGNYSDDECQCLNTGQMLLKIQYFDHNTL